MSERCARGHKLTPENTYTRPDGKRRCRECHREENRETRRLRAQEYRCLEPTERERAVYREWWQARFTPAELEEMAWAFERLLGPVDRLTPRQIDAMKRSAA